MKQHPLRARQDRRARRLARAATARHPRPTARDHYAAATLATVHRALG